MVSILPTKKIQFFNHIQFVICKYMYQYFQFDPV